MARIKCPDCKKKVSEKAEACPKCGYPIKANIKEIRSKERKKTLLGFIVLVVIVSLIVVFSSSKEGEKGTESKISKETHNKSAKKIKKSELVRDIQKRLSHLGIDVGAIDGIYGPKTKSAILRFQEEHNLPSDGKVSESLLKHLNEALNSKLGLAKSKKNKKIAPGLDSIGGFYAIRSKGLESVIATSKNSWDSFGTCLIEHDLLGVRQMIERGELIAVKDGTKVQLLDIPGWFSTGTAKIRIWDGEHAGVLGYTLTSNLHPMAKIQNKVDKPSGFQNEPDEFRGIKWGQKQENIDGMSFFEKGQKVSFYRRMNDEKKLNALELSDLLYGFTKDRFSDIFFIIAPKADRIKERGEAADVFESLKEILFKKHRIPTREHLADPLKGERIDTYKWIGSKVNVSLNFDLPSKVTLLKYWYTPLHKEEISFPSWELYAKGRTFSEDLRFKSP